MRKISFFIILILISSSFNSCNNSTSESDKTSATDAYDSLSVVSDTVSQHPTTFSTAIHQMTNDLNQIPITGDADRDFTVILKSHQQGAIELAQAELRMGENNSLKKIAQDISNSYKPEITSLKNFSDSIKKGPLALSLSKDYENTGFGEVIAKYKSMTWDIAKMDTNMVADKQFVATIIPHLQSAVYLAEGFLKFGKEPWLIQKSKQTITLKMKQIQKLKEWTNANKRTP